MTVKQWLVKRFEQLNRNRVYFQLGHGLFPRYHILSTEKTIEHIIKTRCSIARFGDGEFDLMFETNDLKFQVRSKEISSALKDVFKISDPNLLICVPRYLNSVKGAKPKVADFWKWYLWIGSKGKNIFNFISSTTGLHYCFGDTQVTRPFDSINRSKGKETFAKIKIIWDNENVLIIEGEQTRMGVGNDLFSNAKSIKRILAPATDAFECRDAIREKTKEVFNNELIILALGPTATVLASDFSKLGMRALDLGHLDIEYEWFLRDADEKIAIPGKWVNESDNGRVYSSCNDNEYNKQIVAKIGC